VRHSEKTGGNREGRTECFGDEGRSVSRNPRSVGVSELRECGRCSLVRIRKQASGFVGIHFCSGTPCRKFETSNQP
jgi:hypothetical protein